MSRAEIKAAARAQLGGRIFANNWLMALVAIIIVGAVCGIAATVIPGIGSIIISGPMSYGLARAFLKQARDQQEMELGSLFNGFSDDFGGTLLIGLMTGIFTFLWSLLFIIPGIVKSYSYSMAYYIKVDHPEYDWKTCINESRALMNGHKGELFVLDLSFIGWYIVGALVLGIGTLWVEAYSSAAHAQFYNNLVSTPAPVAQPGLEYGE